MQGLEWVFSIILAIVFLLTGVIRAFRVDQARDRFKWAREIPRPLVQIIGIFEILGALGLILPVATGLYPWLTPIAAAGLAMLMFMAATFHTQRRETSEATVNLLLLVLLVLVAYIRWPLLP